MRAGFRMHADMIGTCLGKGGDVGIDRGDHQMHVQLHRGMRAQGFDDQRAEGDVGDEMAVHDIQMQPFRAGALHRFGFFAQAGEISGQKAGGDEKSSRMRGHRTSL